MQQKYFTLFDDSGRTNLLPFTFTRPASEIRTGILTIREKWETVLKLNANWITESYLSAQYSFQKTDSDLFINGRCFPDNHLISLIQNLQEGEAIFKNDDLIACRTKTFQANTSQKLLETEWRKKTDYPSASLLNHVWEIFLNNHQQIEFDFKLITGGRKSQPVSETNFYKDSDNIFIEEGAKVEFAFLNTTDGPIYIGKNAVVMEGAMIRGPFALCNHSEVKMGAKMYTGTTIGPHCKVGGEINNSVIFGFSNKAHDGFLGNSVIGEWCNLGADTNNSNLKNDYSNVKLWNFEKQKFSDTGLQFCGLMMGDHSKSGINTMFNTGSVIGVCCNIFGDGFPRNFIPNFSWGGAGGVSIYQIEKAIQVATLVMERRKIIFSDEQKNILIHLFQQQNQSIK